MMNYVIRPVVRPVASRLVATPTGTSVPVDYQQQQPPAVFSPSDSSFVVAQPPTPSGGWHNGSAASLPVIWPMHSVFEDIDAQSTAMPTESTCDTFEDVDRQMVATPIGSEFGDSLPTVEPSLIAADHQSGTFTQVHQTPLDYNTQQTQATVWFQPVPVSVLWPVFRTLDGTLMYSLPVQADGCDTGSNVCHYSTSPSEEHQIQDHQRQDIGAFSASASQPLASSLANNEVESGKGARRQRRSRRGGTNRRSSAMAASTCTEDSVAFHEVADMPLYGEIVSNDASQDAAWGNRSTTQMRHHLTTENANLDFYNTCKSNKDWQVEVADEEDDVPIADGVNVFDSKLPLDVDNDPVLLELEDIDKRQATVAWVLDSVMPLALTKRGCRIVQKTLEIGTADEQQQIVDKLHGHAREALRSPHANHVLQRCIETMPPERMQFVLDELRGEAAYAARHRFGCRIIQRLIEHCPKEQSEDLIVELLEDTAKLCRHQYGNFVIQHILQHGSPEHQREIVAVLCADTIRLAKHRIASHVLSCAMLHCFPEDVRKLIQIVLHDSGQLADLSRRQYGSFVVREVNRVARLLDVNTETTFLAVTPAISTL